MGAHSDVNISTTTLGDANLRTLPNIIKASIKAFLGIVERAARDTGRDDKNTETSNSVDVAVF